MPVSYAGVTRIRFDGSALNLSALAGPPTVLKGIAGGAVELKPQRQKHELAVKLVWGFTRETIVKSLIS